MAGTCGSSSRSHSSTRAGSAGTSRPARKPTEHRSRACCGSPTLRSQAATGPRPSSTIAIVRPRLGLGRRRTRSSTQRCAPRALRSARQRPCTRPCITSARAGGRVSRAARGRTCGPRSRIVPSRNSRPGLSVTTRRCPRSTGGLTPRLPPRCALWRSASRSLSATPTTNTHPSSPNPRHDAGDMAAQLKKLGFTVILGLDLDKAAIDRKVREFAEELSNAAVALFFYAGHGLQVDGQNYVVPTDAKLSTKAALDFELVRLDLIQRTMERETN